MSAEQEPRNPADVAADKAVSIADRLLYEGVTLVSITGERIRSGVGRTPIAEVTTLDASPETARQTLTDVGAVSVSTSDSGLMSEGEVTTASGVIVARVFTDKDRSPFTANPHIVTHVAEDIRSAGGTLIRVYACGPGHYVDAVASVGLYGPVRDALSRRGWVPNSIHGPASDINGYPFETWTFDGTQVGMTYVTEENK